MTQLVYEIVEHDGGWAYKVGNVYSEAFPTHEMARLAAEQAAAEQRQGGQDEEIEYEDSRGVWHQEHAPGGDRPDTEVKDD